MQDTSSLMDLVSSPYFWMAYVGAWAVALGLGHWKGRDLGLTSAWCLMFSPFVPALILLFVPATPKPIRF